METYTREEGKIETVDDPKARELLQRAFAKTSRWPANFGGFEADPAHQREWGRNHGKKSPVKSSKEVEVSLPNEDLQKWAQGQISMIATHRGAAQLRGIRWKIQSIFRG